MLTIPEKTVISLKDSRVRIEPGMLGYERDHKGEIAANWVADSTANPDLFNGPFFMAEQAAVSDGTFEAVYRRTRFATMMHWKKNRSPLKPWH
ncbi:MAG: NUDIX hydrolase, partial [Phyllobacterium sp.]